ncbi:uncharacterized protein [Leptinotarsa decemlineata]|uniref:uncharacterized protein n=1 Tax=Leptinotarsa decemlineata TaxID=7539 RepID=UPI003D3041BF
MLTPLNCLSFKRSHRKVQFNSTVSFVIMIIFLVFSETVHGFIRFKNKNHELFTFASAIFIFSLPAITTNLFVLILSTKILIVKERFTLINTELLRMRKDWHINYPKLKKHGIGSIPKQFDYQYNEGIVISVLEKLRLSYCRMEKLKQDLISIYGFPLLITVLRLFMYPLGYFLRYMEWCADSCLIDISAAFVAGPFVNTLQLSTLAYIGTWTSKEAKKAAFILHSMEHTSEEMSEYIKYFSGQVLFMEINITVFGLFTLNESLLFRVMSELISFVILFIQTGES